MADNLRRLAEEVLFPELANELPHNRERLQFGEEAEGQIQRVMSLLDADEKVRRVEAVLDALPVQGPAGLRHRIRAALDGRP